MAIDLALGGFAGRRLWILLDAGAGPQALAARLWLVALGVAAAFFGLGLLAASQHAFGPSARLLFTLPLPPAVRARGLCGQVAIELANLWLLGTGVPAIVLAARLGVAALPWIALVVTAAGLGLTATIAFTLARVRSGRTGALILTALTIGSTVVALSVHPATSDGPPMLPPPAPVAAGMALILLSALGPGAALFGRLYESALLAAEGTAPRAGHRRLLRALAAPLQHRRTMATALITRELLSRGRHWGEWGRLAFLAALALLFPALHRALTPRGVSDLVLVVGGACALVLLGIVDGASSPLGGEGSRLILLLTAPISTGRLLRAEWSALYVPCLAGGCLFTLGFSFWSHLQAVDVLEATFIVALILAGLVAVFAWGSAWDADLDLEIEPGIRGYIQEVAPVTPVRMALLAAGALLLTLDLLALASLPFAAVLCLLAALNALVALAIWKLAGLSLARLAAP